MESNANRCRHETRIRRHIGRVWDRFEPGDETTSWRIILSFPSILPFSFLFGAWYFRPKWRERRRKGEQLAFPAKQCRDFLHKCETWYGMGDLFLYYGLYFCCILNSGSAMNVAYGPVELKKFLGEAARVSQVSKDTDWLSKKGLCSCGWHI